MVTAITMKCHKFGNYMKWSGLILGWNFLEWYSIKTSIWTTVYVLCVCMHVINNKPSDQVCFIICIACFVDPVDASWSVNWESMNSLGQDQHLHPGCCDKTTASCDPSDTNELTMQPLQGLKLASHSVLEEAQHRGRLKCSKCGGSRMFFCYTCCSLVGVTLQEIPSVKVSTRLALTWNSAATWLL